MACKFAQLCYRNNTLRCLFLPYRKRSVLKTFQAYRDTKRWLFIFCFHFNIPKLSQDTALIGKSTTPYQKQKNVPNNIKLDRNGKISLSGTLLGSLYSDQLKSILHKFNLKNFKPEYLSKYGVQISEDHEFLFFPMTGETGELTAVQYQCLNDDNQNSNENICTCSGDYLSIFGWPDGEFSSEQIIVTHHALDAIAINQETNITAIAINFRFKSILPQLFQLLDKFQKIILWFSNDQQNAKLYKFFLENLGKKTFCIRPEALLAPLLCLENKKNFNEVLTQAYPLKHETVETSFTFQASVLNEFSNYSNCCGFKWKRFHLLNQLLKGHRPGELTIFSGQTGTGKTTFMSEYSLDLCMEGMPTLWGSFEVSNTRLLKTMYTQFSMCSLKDQHEKVIQVASEFKDLHLFFLHFNGDHILKQVLEAMRHSVVVHDVQHIVIDNLQFMMNNEDLNSTVDHLRRQDRIFSAFRKFATQFNCHVTLVMHPRKEPEFTELNNTSISGSAKAIQEADNIIILQTTKMKQYLQVTKNRFDGEKGCIFLDFDSKTLTYSMKRLFKL